MFQFHKVRLKGVVERITGTRTKKFQFHKVRLKVAMQDKRNVQRPFQFHKVRLKGEYDCVTICGFTKFQFHKVRLKVTHNYYLLQNKLCFNSIRYD